MDCSGDLSLIHPPKITAMRVGQVLNSAGMDNVYVWQGNVFMAIGYNDIPFYWVVFTGTLEQFVVTHQEMGEGWPMTKTTEINTCPRPKKVSDVAFSGEYSKLVKLPLNQLLKFQISHAACVHVCVCVSHFPL